MQLKSLDEVCGMDDEIKREIEQSDMLVLKAIKNGKEKALISVIPKEKKMLAFKANALIAGTDYELVVKENG